MTDAQQPESEIGRELRASELKPKTIVVLERPDSAVMTVWVAEITAELVIFWLGAVDMNLIVRRVGPDLEKITDDTGLMLRVFEYLGEP